MPELIRTLAALFRRSKMDRELDEELAFHLAMKASEAGDLHAARRAIGNQLFIREQCRDAWGWIWLTDFLQDCQHSARILRREPGFASIVILAIALTIGANTLMFSVVDHVLLRPLPFPDPDRLVLISGELEPGQRMMVSPLNFAEWRAQSESFTDMGAEIAASFDLLGGAYPEHLPGRLASASLFHTLGVQPQLGRMFRPEEERYGNDHVLLISDHLWRRHFHGDPRVLGSTLKLRKNGGDGARYTIVGILPSVPQSARCDPCRSVDAHVPRQPELSNRRAGGATVIARLRTGVSIRAATQEMSAVAATLARQFPKANRGLVVKLDPLHHWVTRSGRSELLTLWGAVAIVLLLGCMNVSQHSAGARFGARARTRPARRHRRRTRPPDSPVAH